MSRTSHKEVEKIKQSHKLCRVGLVQTLKLKDLPSSYYICHSFPKHPKFRAQISIALITLHQHCEISK